MKLSKALHQSTAGPHLWLVVPALALIFSLLYYYHKCSFELSLNLNLSILSQNYLAHFCSQKNTNQPTALPVLSLCFISPLHSGLVQLYSFSLILSFLINKLDTLLSSEIMESPPSSILPSQCMEKQECRKVLQAKKISKVL